MTDIIDLPQNINPAGNDFVPVVDTAGTGYKVALGDLYKVGISDFTNTPAWNNNVLHEVDHGTTLTAAQIAEISSGNLTTVGLGDTWEIDGVKIRLIGFDTHRRKGDVDLNRHHAMFTFEGWCPNASGEEFAPDGTTTHFMNSSDTTVGGYVGTAAYTNYLSQTATWLATTFGSNLINFREFFSNSVTSGAPNSGNWYDCRVALFNEVMVFGTTVNGNCNNGAGLFNVGIDNAQVPYFRLRPNYFNQYHTMSVWLRDVVSDSMFASVGSYGEASRTEASNGWRGLRGFFLIG